MSEQDFKKRIKAESQEKRDRDYKILELLTEKPELTQEEVIQLLELEITQPCVSMVVRDNMILYLDMVMKLNPLSLKGGRIVELIKHYRMKRKQGTKKDPTDLLEQLRKEIEGDRPLIDQSQHQHFTKVDINTEEFRSKSTNEKIDLILGRIK